MWEQEIVALSDAQSFEPIEINLIRSRTANDLSQRVSLPVRSARGPGDDVP
ncbi:hypothetical protein [Cognatiyoonia sp. IB215182]|uniref:hypothetical protein n=1 Tax=Cognatiyoonia sp. IB215182 TaxID=3097353 RepID=UPI002A16140C|nr:hypothetical protein [Cognatiyoonia sp. IB215182]MDX8354842.1 hypothetical protein [Cognatiyoonia sp. IB215182]